MDGKILHEQLGKGMFPSEDKSETVRPEHRVSRLFQGVCTDADLKTLPVNAALQRRKSALGRLSVLFTFSNKNLALDKENKPCSWLRSLMALVW